MKIAILDDWSDTLRSLPSFSKLDGHDVEVWTSPAGSEAETIERLRGREAVVLFRERTPVTRTLIEALPALRLVSGRGSYSHVDLEACARAGVTVCSKAAGGAAHATAELAFALILMAARRLPEQMAALRAGCWQGPVGTTLHGKRLGVWSFGRIGAAVAAYARAFGMEVVAHGSASAGERALAAGFAFEPDRERFFSGCDVVSLHLRANEATRAIVGARELSAMKPSAILVNTSRTAILAPGALEAALRAGRPGFAATDVFEDEPVTDPDHPWLALPNLMATPHIGFVTREELDAQFADAYDQVNAFAAGAPIHVVG